MGIFSVEIFEEIEKLEPDLRKALIKILRVIEKNLGEVVKREDFIQLYNVVNKIGEKITELTEAQKHTERTVNELVEAQKRTEQRINDLAEAHKRSEERITRLEQAVAELTEAHKRSEERITRLEKAIAELTEAQKQTEQRVNELAEAQKKTEEEVRKLAIGLGNLRGEVGGLSRTISYAFENEAYRKLPEYLFKKHHIEITEKFIRTEINQEEINFFAKGRKNGKELYIVGEAKLRLEENKRDFERVFKELERKVKAIKSEYGEVEIVKMIVTHFAKKTAIKLAEERGIIIVQSFEF
ncbi:MAG: hypothetical protein ABDH19_01475 [Thermodesulfovibrio sp.]